MAEAPRLRTDRLVFEPFSDEHLEALLSVFQAPEVRRFLLDGRVVDRGWMEAEVAASRELFELSGYGLWALRRAGDDGVAGAVGYRFFYEPPELQLVIALAPELWGMGLATEACREAIRYGLEEGGLERIVADVDAGNGGSVRLVERLGMRQRGRRTRDGLDTIRYVLEPEGSGGKRLVTSSDGARIAVWRGGTGPPLLLVHGMIADHSTTWRHVRAGLEERFSVHAMDRRGRGGSGDGPRYDLSREAEDVAAVLDGIGEPTLLVGHSFGGLCAAEAALISGNIARLVVYEGMILKGKDVVPPGLTRRFERMLSAGDVEEMLLAFLRDFVGLSEPDIEVLRSDRRAWNVRLGNARTIPREMEVERRYVFAPARFAAMRVPTLLLVGGDSPKRQMETAETVAQALPRARVSVMEGQEHLAMYTDPDQFISQLIGFWKEAVTD